MPLPILLVGLGLGATALGVGAHLDARDTNEQAAQMMQDAQALYNKSKNELEAAKKESEKALVALGNTKKKVLEGSIPRFLRAYRNLNAIRDVTGINTDEVSKFSLAPQDVLDLEKLSNQYSSVFASGTAGAATGALIALAANGTLPIITSTLSIAGTALSIGEVGMAASLAGSAVSLGASMTPLAAIAAPVVLFTGISSSFAADENLEKAKVAMGEAESASAKMAVEVTMCGGIKQKAEMFDSLLRDLESIFLPCTILLEKRIQSKKGWFGHRKITVDSLSQEELNLVAVTRSLAGAVKAVLATPILDSDGKLAAEADIKYEVAKQELPQLEQNAHEAIALVNSSAGPALVSPQLAVSGPAEGASGSKARGANVSAVFVSLLMTVIFGALLHVDLPVTLIYGAFCGITVLDTLGTCKGTQRLKNIFSLWMMGGFCSALWVYGRLLITMHLFLLADIAIGFALFYAFGTLLPGKETSSKKQHLSLCRISGCGCSYCIALLALFLLHGFLHLPWMLSVIVSGAAMLLCMLLALFFDAV